MRRWTGALCAAALLLTVAAGCGRDEAVTDAGGPGSVPDLVAGPDGTTPGTTTVPGTVPPGTAPDPATTTTAPVVVAPPIPTVAAPNIPDGPADPPPLEPAACGAAQDGYAPIGGGRRVLVRASPSTTRRPAVVVLHGYTGVPERIETASGWTPFARQRGAVVAYPEGTPVAAGGFGWNTGSARFSTSGVDDVGYLVGVIDHLVATACVDPARILVTGESNGGAMTLLAACSPELAARAALFAPVIPAIDQGVVDRCGDGPPVALVALAGRLDPVIPYDGVYPAGQIPLLAQEAWFAQVAMRRNGCAGHLDRRPLAGATAITAGGCPADPLLVAIDDGTHTWPGGVAMGSQAPGRFPATAFLWDRFGGG
jgi:polyhydroxybutyrate depolymerase